jgi:hypothetical protein
MILDEISPTARARFLELGKQSQALALEIYQIIIDDLRATDPVKHERNILVLTAVQQQLARVDLSDPTTCAQLIGLALPSLEQMRSAVTDRAQRN